MLDTMFNDDTLSRIVLAVDESTEQYKQQVLSNSIPVEGVAIVTQNNDSWISLFFRSYTMKKNEETTHIGYMLDNKHTTKDMELASNKIDILEMLKPLVGKRVIVQCLVSPTIKDTKGNRWLNYIHSIVEHPNQFGRYATTNKEQSISVKASASPATSKW